MNFPPQVAKAVETLNYRVTVGEIASQAGLDLQIAQAGLLALAADAGGHLQVTESGDVIYAFPEDFRNILRNKYFKIRLKESWDKIWKILFYLIRISFGIALIISIVIMVIAILVIIVGLSSSRDENRGGGSRRSPSGSGGFDFPMLLFWGPNMFDVFTPGYYDRRRITPTNTNIKVRSRHDQPEEGMGFLEGVFSFLFGDGDPNANLEEMRWQTIGTVIRNNAGAVIAEQIAPYFDEINAIAKEEESYMIPVLAKFNGYPEVSPDGHIIYYFPELQVLAQERKTHSVQPYLQENPWKFTEASQGQKFLAIGLGGLNLVLALVLGSLIKDPVVIEQLGVVVTFLSGLYPVLFGYGIAFLTVPLGRFFWLQNKNQAIAARNQQRQERIEQLQSQEATLQAKLTYAQEFARQKVLSAEDVAYSSDRDLLDQNIERSSQIDAEWEKRLNQGPE